LVKTFKKIPEQDIAAGLSKTGILFFYITKFNRDAKQPRLQVIFSDNNIFKNPGDFWQDIRTTGAIANEGGVSLPNGKKPEKLIMRVLQALSMPGDIVLDSFLGSGTTASVAHKMKRKWIGIEIGDQVYTHCIPRLNNVINGDQTGVSKELNWNGGGGYRFYELGPSLLTKHKTLPIYEINSHFTFDMLCKAICKIEGFNYQLMGEMHGKSSENRYIHISSELITGEYIKSITKELGENDSIVIYGTKIQTNLKLPDNIEVKRIPKDLLKKYDFESEVR
jgi:adenine-specific DNA-methyltransferase